MAQNVFVPVTTLGAAKGQNKEKKNRRGEVYLYGGGAITVQGYKDYVEGVVALHGGGAITVTGQKDTIPAVFGTGAVTMPICTAQGHGVAGVYTPPTYEAEGAGRVVYPPVEGKGKAIQPPCLVEGLGVVGAAGKGKFVAPTTIAAGIGHVGWAGRGKTFPQIAVIRASGVHGAIGHGEAIIPVSCARGVGRYDLFSDEQIEEILAMLLVA